MLSISKAIKGHGQAEYYIGLASSDDYYLDAEEPPGFWLGAGAEALGLTGLVIKDQFRNLFRGHSPDGGTQMVRNAGSEHRRAGWDLTWSVPKSVSTAWSQSPPWVRSRIESVVHRAVGEGIHYLEGIGLVTRRGENGVIREDARLIFAAFPHSTSRTQDPQLHVHSLLLNVAVRPDGSTGTIDPREMFRHQHTADALFQAELAAQLERHLGFSAVREGRAFEIVGVDRALMKTFSKRRQQIETVLQERGLSGSKAAEMIAFETRTRKTATPREVLFAGWLQTGRDHGWSTKEVTRLVRPPIPRDQERERRQASEAALERLTFHDSHFAVRDLTRAIALEAQGRGLFAADVHALREALLQPNRLIPLTERCHELRYTTPEMLEIERQFLEAANTLRQAATVFTRSGPPISDILTRHPTLTSEQRVAVESVTSTYGGIHVVSGMAGTGKSFTFGVAREYWEAHGMAVLGACLSGKAASGLEEGSGIRSTTLHRLLWDLGRGKTRLDGHSVVLIDEAAMVGTRQLRDLTQACAVAKAKLVLVGDSGQLQAVEAGGGFATLAGQIGTVTLTEIIRQRDAWARDAVKDFASGRAETALAAYDDHGLLTYRQSAESAEARLLRDWIQTALDDPQGKIMLAGTNAEVARLNLAAQQARHEAGLLPGEPLLVGEAQFLVNDRVLFLRNQSTLDVFNGELGTIRERHGNILGVTMDQGRDVRVDTVTYPHLRLGYALTTHKAQGMTAEEVFVLTGGMQSRELTYVQASRARGATRFYVSGPDIDDVADQMNFSRPKEMATEIKATEGLTQELMLVR